MNDLFALTPTLWFGLLCEGIATDSSGRLNFQSVFNQVQFLTPSVNSGVPPNAFLNAAVAVGFTEGLGHFSVALQLRDVEDHVLWERTEPWEFDIGPGERSAAVLVQPVQYWFKEPGRYHYWIQLTPNGWTHAIQFEVAAQVGPVELAPDDHADA